MENIPFVIWMLGYPVVMWIIDSDIEIQGKGAMRMYLIAVLIRTCLYFYVGKLLYKKKPN